MENAYLIWIQLIVDIIAAIATPVAIIVAVKQYKKNLSLEIKATDSVFEIYIINECPYPIFITNLLINKKPYAESYFSLLGYEIKHITFSNEAIKESLYGSKDITIVVESSNYKKIKRKVPADEIKL